MELAVLFLAGLSLFFTGVNGVKSKLQQMSGRKFRQVLARVTDRPILAGLVGAGFGALTQSASAVAFILSGMVATGLLPLRRALPVVAASNVGTALLVFLAAFDIRLAILALIGITGVMINFRIAARFEAFLGACFAIGLLFLGLGMMKEAFAPLPGYEWFRALAAFLKTWTLAPFLLGAALRMVVQSSSAIGVIAIALQAGGLFTEFQSVMLVCGTGPGVALSGLFLGGNLSGPPRQTILFQGIINLLSGCVVGSLFLLGETFDHKFLSHLLNFAALDASGGIAWAFFLNMSGCLLVGLGLAPFIEPLLQKLAPPSLAQDLSRPAFLHDGALDVPATALELVDKEQFRLYALTFRVLDTIREETRRDGEDDEPALHAASVALRQEISHFLRELIQRGGASAGLASSILLLERRQENLGALADTLHRFVSTQHESHLPPDLQALMARLAESLHLILTMAQDAWVSRDETDLSYLLKLTEDRNDMMERLRRSYQSADASAQNAALFYATSLFERMIWLLRQLGLSLVSKK